MDFFNYYMLMFLFLSKGIILFQTGKNDQKKKLKYLYCFKSYTKNFR